MIKKRKELIPQLKCEEICVLQTTGKLKNTSLIKEVKYKKGCRC